MVIVATIAILTAAGYWPEKTPPPEVDGLPVVVAAGDIADCATESESFSDSGSTGATEPLVEVKRVLTESSVWPFDSAHVYYAIISTMIRARGYQGAHVES